MASGRSRASRARLFTTAKPRVLTRPNLVWLRKREHCRSMWGLIILIANCFFPREKKHPACTNGATFPSIHLSIISLSFSFLASTIDTKLWLHNFSQYFLQNAGSSSCSCVKMWKTWSKNRGRWEQLTLSVGYPPQVEICRLQLHESKKSKKHTEATHTTCTRKLNNFCQSNKLHGTAKFSSSKCTIKSRALQEAKLQIWFHIKACGFWAATGIGLQAHSAHSTLSCNP